MPYQLLHKCYANDPEAASTDFAVMQGDLDGKDTTKVQCPKCREGFYVMGHQFFNEARRTSDRQRILGRAGFMTTGRTD